MAFISFKFLLFRSSRPTRPAEHQDSQSSGEEEDDDGFEMFSAESLFSTLLNRVRILKNNQFHFFILQL